MGGNRLASYGAIAVLVLAAFLLGLSINVKPSATSTSNETAAAAPPPPPAPTQPPLAVSAALLATPLPAATPQPVVVHLQVTVKGGGAAPDVEVQSAEGAEVQVTTDAVPTSEVLGVQATRVSVSGVAVVTPAGPAPPAAPPLPAATRTSTPTRTPTPAPQVSVRTTTPSPAVVVTATAVVASSQSLSFVRPTIAPPTPDPCTNRICAKVGVVFAGSGSSHGDVQATCNVATNATAWECLKQAIGVSNIKFQDFGGSLGIFVSGLFGVEPDFGKCSCFWEFTVNGASSNVGVSGYIVKTGNTLGFRIGK